MTDQKTGRYVWMFEDGSVGSTDSEYEVSQLQSATAEGYVLLLLDRETGKEWDPSVNSWVPVKNVDDEE